MSIFHEVEMKDSLITTLSFEGTGVLTGLSSQVQRQKPLQGGLWRPRAPDSWLPYVKAPAPWRSSLFSQDRRDLSSQKAPGRD